MGAIRANLGAVVLAWANVWGFEVKMRQYEYELICSRTLFCFANISAPFYRTEMVVYAKRAYGSQFSGEKNDLKIGYLVNKILSKYPV